MPGHDPQAAGDLLAGRDRPRPVLARAAGDRIAGRVAGGAVRGDLLLARPRRSRVRGPRRLPPARTPRRRRRDQRQGPPLGGDGAAIPGRPPGGPLRPAALFLGLSDGRVRGRPRADLSGAGRRHVAGGRDRRRPGHRLRAARAAVQPAAGDRDLPPDGRAGGGGRRAAGRAGPARLRAARRPRGADRRRGGAVPLRGQAARAAQDPARRQPDGGEGSSDAAAGVRALAARARRAAAHRRRGIAARRARQLSAGSCGSPTPSSSPARSPSPPCWTTIVGPTCSC